MKKLFPWILRLVPAVLLGQTLPFKFSGHEQSVELFSTLATKALHSPGLEPLLRIGTGVIELIAVIALLIPRFSLIGALLVIGTMIGALASHFAFIGFAGQNGQLAGLATIAAVFAAFYVLYERRTHPISKS